MTSKFSDFPGVNQSSPAWKTEKNMPSHSRSKKKNTDPVFVPQIQTQLQSSSWVQSAEMMNPDLEVPELQMEPEPREGFGQGFGHSLGNISISSPSTPSESPEVSPIQMKGLTIGQPGDKYEKEADTVARKVVSQINSPVSESSQSQGTVQRTTATVNPSRKFIQRTIDYKSFLTDKSKVSYLIEFAKEQHNENEVLFWHAVKHFNKSPNLPDARAIYEKYLNNEKFSIENPKNFHNNASVNINDQIRDKIYNKIYIDKKVDNQTFEEAQKSVEYTMGDLYAQFSDSEQYGQYKLNRRSPLAKAHYLIDTIKGLVAKRKGHVKGKLTEEEKEELAKKRGQVAQALLEEYKMIK